MNERIRELAGQALEYAEKNQSADIPRHWFRLHNEKFAELIVRDIHQYVDSMDTAQIISTGILRRYGVEL
jgi:hypothetical protein